MFINCVLNILIKIITSMDKKKLFKKPCLKVFVKNETFKRKLNVVINLNKKNTYQHAFQQ